MPHYSPTCQRPTPRFLSWLILGIGTLIILLSLLFIGYDHSDASAGDHRIFDVTLTSITPNDHGEWLITGTTAAPDGAKLIGLGEQDVTSAASAPNSSTAWTTVRHGQFTTTINAYQAVVGHHYATGQTVPVKIVAVTAYQQRQYDLLPAGLRDQIQQFEPDQLKLNHDLAQHCLKRYRQTDGFETL